jgi:hypothetical protein
MKPDSGASVSRKMAGRKIKPVEWRGIFLPHIFLLREQLAGWVCFFLKDHLKPHRLQVSGH